MASIYLHIPFCQSRCIYCDFYSTTSLSVREQYTECLVHEMRQRQKEWPLRAQTLSIYIGGGTPSTLSAEQLQRILRQATGLFPVAADAEITIEANPDDVTDEWVEALRETPVNRISMGVQTFHGPLLHTLRRRHNAEQARKAVDKLQRAGYHNLSIDLIYGLPGQTLALWEADIEEALRLDVPHLSAYSLMFEEGTPLTRMLEAGLVEEMDDDLSWRCYEILCQRLEAAGYEHYEISNFARPGMHSRHNSAYWTGEPYLGFGAGAHSYDGQRTRRCNLDSLDDYLYCLSPDKEQQPRAGGQRATDNATGGDTYFELEELSDTDLYNEFVMTRLRTSRGFSLPHLAARFGQEALAHCLEGLQPHLQQGHITKEGEQIRLTRQGVFVSNDVISDLFL